MIWQQPWAWLGVAAIAIPVLVHLLARRHATRAPFPSLRFVPRMQATSVRRHRLTDLPLLTLRAMILATAAAALAQPFVLTSGRTASADATLARAVVVDVSRSMSRPSSDGRPAIALARERATALVGDAAHGTTIEGAALGPAIASASAWLARAGGRRELVVISDFQAGAIDRIDLAGVPAAAGVTFVRLSTGVDTAPVALTARVGRQDVSASVRPAPDRTDVTWQVTRVAETAADGLRVVTGESERANVAMALDAARGLGPVSTSPDRPVVVVFPDGAPNAAAPLGTPGGADRDARTSAARPISEPWMFEVAQRTGLRGARPAQTPDGSLVLFAPTSEPMAAATFLATAMGAPADLATLTELDPATIPADVLTALERPPSREVASGAVALPGQSDGRWVWALVLVLMVVEAFVRRRLAARRPMASSGIPHELPSVERDRVA